MNEELKAKLNEMSVETLDKLQQYLSGAEQFAQEQIPALYNEIIMWGMAKHIFYFSIFFTIAFTLFLIGVYLIRIKDQWTDSDGLQIQRFIGCMLQLNLLFTFPAMCANLYEIIHIYFAPRLYVLEQISQLL